MTTAPQILIQATGTQGAGKTTLMNAIADMLREQNDAGRYSIRQILSESHITTSALEAIARSRFELDGRITVFLLDGATAMDASNSPLIDDDAEELKPMSAEQIAAIEPYVEHVLTHVDGSRRVGRLNHDRTTWQLSSYSASTNKFNPCWGLDHVAAAEPIPGLS